MAEVSVVYPRIDAAAAFVDVELEVVEEEADAFQAFLARLRRLEPSTSTPSAGGGSLALTATVAGVDPDDVRAAYRDTVMAMDHYQRDYGEPLLVNVGAEFGDSATELLGGNTPISPTHRGVIETAAERAVEERQRFRRLLTNERDSLRTVARRLGEIERELHECRQEQAVSVEAVGFGSGQADRLRDLAADCQALSAERQRSIHRRPVSQLSGIGEQSLVEYLYGECDHRFPALVEIADVAERIEAAIEG